MRNHLIKNRIKPLLGTCAIVLGIAVSGHAQDPFTNGLVAFYPFNGNANDASGNQNNGVVMGASLTTNRFGIPNSAYAFDGSAVISVPLTQTNVLHRTVSAWFKTPAGGVIVGTSNDSAPESVLGIHTLGTGGAAQTGELIWVFDAVQSSVGQQSDPLFADNRWHQVVAVFDGVPGVALASQFWIYVDGRMVTQAGHSVNPQTIPFTSGSLLIGSHQRWAAKGGNFTGCLDDLRFYSRVLSAAEVQQLFFYEAGPQLDLVKAVKPSFSNLTLGTNYQLQVSGDLNTWTNHGTVFTATNTSMVYPQYWDVGNWGKLFFRLQVAP